MAENTKIEWAKHSFNHVRGCTKVSAGCANCYAETLSKRNPLTLGVWGPNGTRVVAAESAWLEPLKWDRLAAQAGERHRVFCASLADVFEDWQGPMVDHKGRSLWHLYPPSGAWTAETDGHADKIRLTMQDVRQRLFDLIDRTQNLDYLLLTKRPENVLQMLPPLPNSKVLGAYTAMEVMTRHNVWIGTSIEDQQTANERIPHLLRVPAKIRFLSMEPLLGPVRFRDVPGFNLAGSAGQEMLRNLWVIVGCESGRHRRPMKTEWAESLLDQCRDAGVGFFMKQMDIDGRVTGDMQYFPEKLKVRDVPFMSNAS